MVWRLLGFTSILYDFLHLNYSIRIPSGRVIPVLECARFNCAWYILSGKFLGYGSNFKCKSNILFSRQCPFALIGQQYLSLGIMGDHWGRRRWSLRHQFRKIKLLIPDLGSKTDLTWWQTRSLHLPLRNIWMESIWEESWTWGRQTAIYWSSLKEGSKTHGYWKAP